MTALSCCPMYVFETKKTLGTMRFFSEEEVGCPLTSVTMAFG